MFHALQAYTAVYTSVIIIIQNNLPSVARGGSTYKYLSKQSPYLPSSNDEDSSQSTLATVPYTSFLRFSLYSGECG